VEDVAADDERHPARMASGLSGVQEVSATADDVRMLTWFVIGAATGLALSVSVGLAVAAILGSVSREASRLLDAEPWPVAPPSRARRLAAIP
jgi:hypothetical protein